jgi:hypothetical protein
MTTQVFSKPLPEPILSLFKLLTSFLNFVPPARATLVSCVTPVTRHIVSSMAMGLWRIWVRMAHLQPFTNPYP